MSTTYKLGYFLKKIDIFGSLIQFNYKKQTTLKTQFGGFLTCICAFLGIFLVYFFGKDIILKDKPFITFTRLKINEDSEVTISKFPLMFKFITPGGDLLPVNDLFYLTADLLILDDNGRYTVEKDVATLIPCNPDTHFGEYKIFLLDPKTQLPNDLYCVTPYKNDTKFVND